MVFDVDALKRDVRSVKDALEKVTDGVKSLEESISVLSGALKAYNKLIDLPTLVPKEKLVRFRLSRMIKRMSFDKQKSMLGVRIELKVGNYRDLKEIIINYIDTQIRPSDMLFLFEDGTVGIIYVIDKRPESKMKVLVRIEEILSNFELQLDYKVKSSISWELTTSELEADDTVDEFLKRLKEGKD